MKRGHKLWGLWINFEAGDGGGKGTQQRLLAEHLRKKGYAVTLGREPGSTPAGEEIRRFLQDPNTPKLNPRTEMLLYVSAGIEFFDQVIKPSLEKGEIMITDRWRYSTQAYQGYGLGIDLSIIELLTKFSCEGAYPDITFLLDIEPEVGLLKVSGYEFGKRSKDKIEKRNMSFHKKLTYGYREIARKNPDRIKVIPYKDGKPMEMHNQIVSEVEKFMEENNLKESLARQTIQETL